jgi:hypothetical protein
VVQCGLAIAGAGTALVRPPVGAGSAMSDARGMFETIVADPVWQVPGRAAGTTPIRCGLRVTNTTAAAARFTRFDTLVPELRAPGGRLLEREGGRDRTSLVTEADCPLLQPGETTEFRLDAGLYWRGQSLQFGGSDGFGGIWYFDGIKEGPHEFRIGYINPYPALRLGTPGNRVLNNMWTGEGRGPYVEIRIQGG